MKLRLPKADPLTLRPAERTKALDSLLSREEFLSMLSCCQDGKDRAILCLGVLGLRASEIGAATASWCDFAQRTITVPARNAKRGKGRVMPFGKIHVICEVLTAFFAIDREVGLSRIAVWSRVKRLATHAGIKHPVTAHGLRATGATFFAQAGWSITGLQNHFGWSELRTAQHYVAASGASAMRDMDEFGGKVL